MAPLFGALLASQMQYAQYDTLDIAPFQMNIEIFLILPCQPSSAIQSSKQF